MKRFMALMLVLASCGGGGGGGDPDAANIDGTNGTFDGGNSESECADGLDNNGDGLADCADPTCASAVTCVAQVPAGWSGHAALAEAQPGSAPLCLAPYSAPLAQAFSGLTVPDATCAACVCGAPSATGCAASGGAPTVPPVAWSREGAGCWGPVSVGGGCSGTDLCQGNPNPPFGPGLCIYSDGDLPCPTGPFTDRHLYYKSVDDTRACTPCTCGAPAGGVCPPSGGAPTGTADPSEPVTFCCTP